MNDSTETIEVTVVTLDMVTNTFSGINRGRRIFRRQKLRRQNFRGQKFRRIE